MSADSLVPVDRGPGGFASSPPPTPPAGPDVERTLPDRCRPLDHQHYDPACAAISVVCVLVGVLYTLFGYRCFKTVMFLTGFIFGSLLIYTICIQDKLLPPYANIAMALSAGMLLGLITMLVQYVGLFMTGFHTGLLAGVAALAAAEQLAPHPPSLLASAATLLGCGLLFAVLTLQCPKALTVLGTSVYGGALSAGGADYLVERLEMAQWVWHRVALRHSPPPCWFGWLLLSAWPSAVLVGVLVQSVFTGKGIHHQQMLPAKHQNRHANMPRVRTREQRAELRQKKYRYLYQVRTAHGDVISQALQRKVIGGGDIGGGGAGESSTLQSDATHVTILPDSAQLAGLTDDEIQLDHRMRQDLHYR